MKGHQCLNGTSILTKAAATWDPSLVYLEKYGIFMFHHKITFENPRETILLKK